MFSNVITFALAVFFVVFGIRFLLKLREDLERDIEYQEKREAYIKSLEERIENLEKEVL